MLALNVKSVLTEDNLCLAVTLDTVSDEGLDTLWQIVLAHPIKDTDDALRIDVGDRGVEGEGCYCVIMDELLARHGLGNSNEEFVDRGVEGVEVFEVDDAVWAGPEGATGMVGFEVHFTFGSNKYDVYLGVLEGMIGDW